MSSRRHGDQLRDQGERIYRMCGDHAPSTVIHVGVILDASVCSIASLEWSPYIVELVWREPSGVRQLLSIGDVLAQYRHWHQ